MNSPCVGLAGADQSRPDPGKLSCRVTSVGEEPQKGNKISPVPPRNQKCPSWLTDKIRKPQETQMTAQKGADVGRKEEEDGEIKSRMSREQ